MAFLYWLFGCRHDWGWPRRNKRRFYQVCLKCGTERTYSGELAA